jgi:D-glycero-alpha-D-manno-heptose-7-phosphate kinase
MPDYRKILANEPVLASAPCRIDLGGTLDLSIFYNTLRSVEPCTFNLALDMRTTVRLLPYRSGRVMITSRGFKPADYRADRVPYDHPLGLMFAVAAYFQADGVHIEIDSASPPRSALGGSSVAAVALAAAFLKVERDPPLSATVRKQISLLTHAIEESTAGVPCGRQDHLAAAFGGINAWYWIPDIRGFAFKRVPVMNIRRAGRFQKHLLLAYVGIPHESKDINAKWVRQFVSGKFREDWLKIVASTKKFIDALSRNNYKGAIVAMNRETAIRRKMTPDVLDPLGDRLVDEAVRHGCAARFTGAGGGGCIWALGSPADIDRLRPIWQEILGSRRGAGLLDTRIDTRGVQYGGAGSRFSPR